MMQDLKLKNDDKTACRWIWELIQNAKEVVERDEAVSIEVDFNYLISRMSTEQKYGQLDSVHLPKEQKLSR